MAVDGARLGLLRSAACGAAAALAGVTVLAAADRAGHSWVDWGPVATSARLDRTVQILSEGSAVRAVAAARSLARAAPVRQLSLSLLGLAEAQAGDASASDAAMRAASMLGWRDEVAQGWAVQRSLATGEARIAAERLQAILRAHPDSVFAEQLLAQVAGDAAARAALASSMAKGGAWTDCVVRSAADAELAQLAARLGLLAEARLAGFDPPVPAVSDAVSRLNRRNPRGALALLVALRGPGSLQKTGLWDAAFGVIGLEQQDAMPFVWTRAETATALLGVVKGNDGSPRLTVDHAGAMPDYVAGVTTIVAPGRHVLTWHSGRGASGDPDLSLDAVCASGGSGVTVGSIIVDHGGFRREIGVPDGCRAIQIRLFAPARGGGTRWLEYPAVRPVG